MSRHARAGVLGVSRAFTHAQTPFVMLIALSLLLVVSTPSRAAEPPGLVGLDALYPSLDALYLDLHRNPELSQHANRGQVLIFYSTNGGGT